MNNSGEEKFLVVLLLILLFVFFARRRWKPSQTAFGTATWASEKLLEAAGMLAGAGLVLGRTIGGRLIRVRNYVHVLLIGTTGSGKGVSIITPNLLSYKAGSVICFDTKGDLYTTTATRRAALGDRIIRLAPFNGGKHGFNPLDTISSESPLLIDSARAMAESLVLRQGEPDPHWNDKAVQTITALLVLILMRFNDNERCLASVQEIVSDPVVLLRAAGKLQEIGGIPARLGYQLLGHFDDKENGTLTKEGGGILSTVGRHLSFLDSELVSQTLAQSSFAPTDLLKPGTTLYIQIPPDQLEAQRGLLRCWIATLIRSIGTAGDERTAEVLLLLDEASALGSLPAVEEALVRGRSAGVRMILAYQSGDQVKTAFKDKPSLIYDNCATHIYLGGASSIEGAERLSKSLGDWTQVLEGCGENDSRSWQQNGPGHQGPQLSKGNSLNYSVNARALLKPEEILNLSDNHLIALHRGLGAPIFARRIKWYQDAAFVPSVFGPNFGLGLCALLGAAVIAIALATLLSH